MKKLLIIFTMILFSFILVSCNEKLKVTFDYEFGTVKVSVKEDINKKYIPKKKDHDFDAWYLDKELTLNKEGIKFTKGTDPIVNIFKEFEIKLNINKKKFSGLDLLLSLELVDDQLLKASAKFTANSDRTIDKEKLDKYLEVDELNLITVIKG